MNVGVIGLGVMGKNHLRVLKQLPGVDIVGVCDIANKEDLGTPFYKDLDLMLEEKNFDALIIAVPTFLHKEIAFKCIKKGINLLIEKPIAQDKKEGEEIAAVAKENGVKTAIGYIERFNPVVLALKENLKDKEIYNISITRVGPIPPRITDVGILTDLSVHDIDLIRYISGKEIVKQNIFKSQKIHGNQEDNAILSFILEGDITASITTNWLTPFKKRTINIATKEVYFQADLMNQTLAEYSSFEGTNKYNSYVISNIFVPKQEPLVNELNAFLHYVKTGEIKNLASAKDSIKTLEISQGVL